MSLQRPEPGGIEKLSFEDACHLGLDLVVPEPGPADRALPIPDSWGPRSGSVYRRHAPSAGAQDQSTEGSSRFARAGTPAPIRGRRPALVPGSRADQDPCVVRVNAASQPFGGRPQRRFLRVDQEIDRRGRDPGGV
jgi:hypothetical protein